VLDRITDSMSRLCRLDGVTPASILFGIEKTGSQQIIDTAAKLLTDDSLLMYGTRGRPVKLRGHLASVAAAFRRPSARVLLPTSIRDLWKADLFSGYSDSDRWVGTSVKVNVAQLEPARGLRLGIVPAAQGSADAPYRLEQRNLVVCPLPYDGGFMEIFYRAWSVVQQFIASDARLPREVALPGPAERQVARYLDDRRDFAVVEVVEALRPIAQPELLDTTVRPADVIAMDQSRIVQEATSVLAPLPSSR